MGDQIRKGSKRFRDIEDLNKTSDDEAEVKRMATLVARMEGIEDSLKCENCKNVPRDIPVHCCPSGHLLCQACRRLTRSCPICGQKITDMTSALAESLIRKVDHRCKFEAQGCQEKKELKEIETHERICPKNPDEKLVRIKFTVPFIKKLRESFIIKVITPMRDLMKSYGERVGIPVTDLRFMFLGFRVNDDETPKILKMMDGDIIQVYHTESECATDAAMYDMVDKITAHDSTLECRITSIEPEDLPISCCTNGHVTIRLHDYVHLRPRMTSCFTCGEDLSDIMQPGAIVYANVLHNCKFNCGVKMRPKYLDAHEAECPHRKGMITINSERIKYRMKMTTKIGELMNSYRSKYSHLINDEDTPTSPDMENDDIIDVYEPFCAS